MRVIVSEPIHRPRGLRERISVRLSRLLRLSHEYEGEIRAAKIERKRTEHGEQHVLSLETPKFTLHIFFDPNLLAERVVVIGDAKAVGDFVRGQYYPAVLARIAQGKHPRELKPTVLIGNKVTVHIQPEDVQRIVEILKLKHPFSNLS